MIDEALRALVSAAVADAVAPLVEEVRELRVALAAQSGRWISRADAARELGVSVDTIDRRVDDGSLQSRRIGRSVRVLVTAPATEAEVRELAVEARGVTATAMSVGATRPHKTEELHRG